MFQIVSTKETVHDKGNSTYKGNSTTKLWEHCFQELLLFRAALFEPEQLERGVQLKIDGHRF